MSPRATRWFVSGCILIALLSSAAWCLSAGRQLGATFDEPTYIAAGLDRWRHGGIGGLMRLGTMPLPVDVSSLPVWIAEQRRGVPFRIASDDRGRPVDATDLDVVLPLARAASAVFWCVLLVAASALAWQTAGPWAAACAAGLLAAEPTLLAHASLATTDIAVTAFLIGFACSIRKLSDHGFDDHSWRALLVPGVLFGLAILSKASALVFAPLILLAAVGRDGRIREWRVFARPMVRIAAIGLALTFVYCGSDWRNEQSFVAWARELPEGRLATATRAVANHLPVFSNAGEGLVQQIKHNIRGHDTFVFGRTYRRAVWFYFPAVLSIKTSAALLVTIAAVLLLYRRGAANWIVAAAGLILLFSPLYRVQQGARMVLPLMALAIVGVSVALARWMADSAPRRRGMVLAGTAMAIAWSAVASWRAWPDGLRYANEFAGGSTRAYRLVSDSNYDWGQGIPALQRWLEKAGHPPAVVWYWGQDSAIYAGRWRTVDVRAMPESDEVAMAERLRGHVVAASTTLMYGSVLSDRASTEPEDLGALTAADVLRRVLRARGSFAQADTFLLYDFTEREPAATDIALRPLQ